MGDVSKSTMKKRKKKGRPSLLDLQKRFLKQQKSQEHHHHHQPLNPRNSSSCQNRNVFPATECVNAGDDDDDERIQKKHKPLLGLTYRQNYPTLSAYSFGEDSEAALKRRRIDPAPFESYEVSEKALKVTDTAHGLQVESGPTTTLPDKKLLIFILDRLQKKDTHEVFSEPVDPNKLPDYHVIIENPMDFGTVRTKLDGGAYSNLEQFEEDIFLICSNAMKYNASDTVFFRQARSIQELAKKDFENLRRESSSDESEPEPEPEQKVVRRGRPPGKSQKKSLGFGNSIESNGADFCSGAAALASGCDDSNHVNGYNLRRARSSFTPMSADPLVRTSTTAQRGETQHGETLTSWLPEWRNEFPASVLKGVLRSGKNGNMVVDENRRDTYNHSLLWGNQPSVFGNPGGDLKQLISVGLHADLGYTRSLALFAADLGPAILKIVSKKINSISGELGQVFMQELDMIHQQKRVFHVNGGSFITKTAGESTGILPCSSLSGSNIGISNNFRNQEEDAEIDRVRNPQSETPLLDRSRSVIGFTTCIPNEPKTNSDFPPYLSQDLEMIKLDAIIGGMPPCSNDSSVPYQIRCTSPALNNASLQSPSGGEDGSRSHSLRHLPSRVYFQESIETQQEQELGEKARWQELSTRPVLDPLTFNPDCNFGLGLSATTTSSNLQILSQIQPDLVLQL